MAYVISSNMKELKPGRKVLVDTIMVLHIVKKTGETWYDDEL